MACITIAFFFMTVFVCVYVYLILFIHSSVNGHLSYLQGFAIINSATVNISVKACISILILNSFEFEGAGMYTYE